MGSREKMTGYMEKRASLDVVHAAADVCRRRIGQLLDPQSFVELDSLVEARGLTFGFNRPKVAGDGVVTGYGTLNGRMVYLAAQDPSVYGGSIGQMHAEKIAKAVQLACEAQVPFIGLYDTGGARIEEGVLGLEGLGCLLSALDDASGQIPLIAAVFGPCAGGAAFAAAASDFVLMSEKGSGLFMNGPMVVSAAENKTLDAAAVGGARIHAEKTGLAALTAPDEDSLIALVRQLMPFLPDSGEGFLGCESPDDDPNRTETRLDELAANLDQGYDMREVINLVVDSSGFLELFPSFAVGMVTGLAKLDGITVGVLAQAEPRITADMAGKAAKLVGLCDRLNLPLITFTDAEGYAIGLAQEQGGLIQAGADLMKAMLRLETAHVGVIIGKAIGTAYLTFNSKNCGADLVYAWPTAEIAVVGPDTAAHIIYRKEIAASADPITARTEFASRYADEVASPYVAASLGHVDEVIQPSATRPRLISALEMLTTAYTM
ncbi:MAG: carboxyl transferase domain-containing protein [Clostridiaceae bacterium]|nr:carboxyl transferase domain-containing protein [Clostridiaceae bacterium]